MYLEKFSETLKQISIFLEKIALKKQKTEALRNLCNEINHYTKDTREFLRKPQELSKSIKNTEYQHSVLLYVCLKQVVALFEAETEALPIQIYNEFRNAYDHFSRGLINKEHFKSHIKKMEGHIQRAFLDTCKLTCYFYQDRVAAVHKRYPRKSLSLVSNGEYLKDFSAMEANSRYLLVCAREIDFNLTEDNNQNIDILKFYIEALISYKNLAKFQSDNTKYLQYNKYKFYFLKGFSIFSAFLLGVISSIAASLLLSKAVINILESWMKQYN
jgi:hypothetical protein